MSEKQQPTPKQPPGGPTKDGGFRLVEDWPSYAKQQPKGGTKDGRTK